MLAPAGERQRGIFAAVCPNGREPIVAPVESEIDREQRRAALRIPGIGEGHDEPIKYPVTGEEHRAKIVLPDDFEYREADMGNAVSWRVSGGRPLEFEHQISYAPFNTFDTFDWSSG